jgi:hypothetical protein
MPVARRLNPYFLFLAVAVSVGFCASFIARSTHRYPLAAGASLDLMLTVPAAWYWLLVRPGLRSKNTVLFVAQMGLLRAAFLFPDVVPGRVWIAGGMELALIALVVTSLRRASGGPAADRTADPIDRLRAVFHRFTPSIVAAKAMASEFSVFYYAFAWKPKPHVPPGTRAFPMHERSGASVLIGCLAVISLVEIVPVHLLLAYKWSATAAWVATGLSVWGAVWMTAISRAFALRPTLVSSDSILVRYGLLFRLRIPVGSIQSIDAGSALLPGTRVIPKDTPPSVCIRFNQPLDAEIMLGFTKRVAAIGLSADDATGFADALRHLDR